MERLLDWYVEEINISRRIGWKHGPPPPPVMHALNFFNEAVGDLSEIHKCSTWERRKLPCPFRVFEDMGILPVRKGDPPDDAPDVPGDARRPAPKFVTPARRRSKVLAEAEAVVAAYPERVPVGKGRTLRDGLKYPVAVGVGVAAGAAIRAVARSGRGGGFKFPSVLDPKVGPHFSRY